MALVANFISTPFLSLSAFCICPHLYGKPQAIVWKNPFARRVALDGENRTRQLSSGISRRLWRKTARGDARPKQRHCIHALEAMVGTSLRLGHAARGARHGHSLSGEIRGRA